MELTIDAVTLAVGDLAASRAFYADGLGCAVEQDRGQYVAFRLAGGPALTLYPRRALAHDAGVDPAGSGFGGLTLNLYAEDAAAVDDVLKRAERAGGTIARPAEAAQWGGYFGYFADPDGHLWKVVAP
ncbi:MULTISPECIES: VOC family protein [unclassified Isoptericola]|uniref:VOC family protein n=1 Tax=unclassified Isoptericola TaxID=2623355 RepID=UPI0036601F2C